MITAMKTTDNETGPASGGARYYVRKGGSAPPTVMTENGSWYCYDWGRWWEVSVIPDLSGYVETDKRGTPLAPPPASKGKLNIDVEAMKRDLEEQGRADREMLGVAAASGGGKNEPWITSYHPDPEIDREVVAEALEGEAYDMSVGDAPWWWQCPACKRSHNRGHHGVIGVHRCLGCGYTGPCGMMSERREDFDDAPPPAEPGETPRTDAAIRKSRMVNPNRGLPTREKEWVSPDFARTLERENAALSAEAERLRLEAREYYVTPEKVMRFESAEEVREMRRKAAGRMLEMEAEVERLRGALREMADELDASGCESEAREMRKQIDSPEALRAEAGKEKSAESTTNDHD